MPAPSNTAGTGAKREQTEAPSGRVCGPALGWPLCSTARAAKEQLGCNDCRELSAEFNRSGEAGGIPAATAPGSATAAADEANSGEDSGARSSDQRGDNHGRDDAAHSDDDPQTGSGETGNSNDDNWWARLRQAERGWAASETNPVPGQGSNSESWVGLRLRLRASDVCSADGQAAILDFLKGRVGRETQGRGEEEGGRDEEEEGGGALPAEETRPPHSTEGVGPTASPIAGRTERTMSVEKEGEGGGVLPSSSTGSPSSIHNTGTKYPAVAAAVLVFGPKLSKRDRAELHVQAEKAGGVASSSHGTGDARFLSLSCGRGSKEGGVEPELSPEQVRVARVCTGNAE